jgi:hypothetical protein
MGTTGVMPAPVANPLPFGPISNLLGFLRIQVTISLKYVGSVGYRTLKRPVRGSRIVTNALFGKGASR